MRTLFKITPILICVFSLKLFGEQSSYPIVSDRGPDRLSGITCVYVEKGSDGSSGYFCVDISVGDSNPNSNSKLYSSIGKVNEALLKVRPEHLVINPYWRPADTPVGWKIRSLTQEEVDQFTVPHRLPRYSDSDVRKSFLTEPLREKTHKNAAEQDAAANP